jgi:hypothetical protein
LSGGITTWTYIVGLAMASLVVLPLLLSLLRPESPDDVEPTNAARPEERHDDPRDGGG